MPLNGMAWCVVLACASLFVGACTPQPSADLMPSALPTTQATATPQPSATTIPTETALPTPTLGVLKTAPSPTLVAFNEDQRLSMFDDIWTYVNERYVYPDYRGVNWAGIYDEYRTRVQTATDTDEFYAIIKEMIELLNDDHTRFDTPQEAAMDAAFFSGEAGYAGIGIIIRNVEEGLMIMRLAQSGPAEMAGVQPFDIITKVDGVSITEIIQSDEEYTRRIRGPIGSEITLEILRDTQRFDVQITRNAISSDAFPEAFTQLLPESDVVFLTIDSFNRQNLDVLVKNALLMPFVAQTPRALIIDIRENYGGSIGSMLDVMALFHSGGVMGEQVGHSNTYQLEVPEGRVIPAFATIPIIILTSGESASAAEMFASGMRSLRGARIIGEVTAGNTENLYPYDLDDGSTLWLAELLFRQTDGTYIDDIGVQPDTIIVTEWGTFKPANDPFVIQALSELTQ